VAVYKVGEVEVQLAHRHADVVWVHTQVRVQTLGSFLQPLAVRRLKRDGLEEDDHDEVEAPHLVRLAQAVDAAHLALLVRVREDAHGAALASDAQHKVLAALLGYVLPQLGQQPRGPLLLHVCFLFLFDPPLLFHRHSFLMFFEVFAFGRLQVEPCVRERLHMRQKGLDEWVEFIL
ncbi:hypothetical protein EGW08_002387, partial [Elysia chlorotica]